MRGQGCSMDGRLRCWMPCTAVGTVSGEGRRREPPTTFLVVQGVHQHRLSDAHRSFRPTAASAPRRHRDGLLPLLADPTNPPDHCSQHHHLKGAAQTWSTSVEELWLFIAVHIFMGIVHLPRAHMYWEERWLQPFVVDAFSRDRFHELLRFFHIAPPTPAGVKHTVLDKVAPLITACQHSFSTCFLPAQVLVVDESMVPFKGREPMKQYLPDKPTSWGYKVWCVASDKYLLNFCVQGKAEAQEGQPHPS